MIVSLATSASPGRPSPVAVNPSPRKFSPRRVRKAHGTWEISSCRQSYLFKVHHEPHHNINPTVPISVPV